MRGTTETAILAGGCFWGMQDLFRKQPGVISTRVGYSGGEVPNATYRNHGTHAEAIEIVFDPERTSYRKVLEFFFSIHDPTTLNRQGNDIGTQYRSAIFVQNDAQRKAAEASKTMYQEHLSAAGYGAIATEIVGPPAPDFYFAEDYHQQYLDKIPNGYCPNHSTGVRLPDDFVVTPLQYVD